ncbi:hypothetical protein G9F72_021470 [Clostridium estertheticum]|uniref:hypothetical protein n=1 Tax=Clostridium estertheticum TaxID=238834 RepID=UPI0013E979B1|nr:hypothetical protein [Clostridium estertheticum]MBZ9688892.1 hypothetical protein [Clostridium estertheticum]
MKKNINKKVLSIAVIIVAIGVIAGVFYIKNKSQTIAPVTTTEGNKVEVASLITATVREAAFSSVVNVTLTDAGKKEYKGAVKYQVFYDQKPATQREVLGKGTTAFPTRKVNDKVVIKLIKADGKEAYSVDLKLQKGAPVK